MTTNPAPPPILTPTFPSKEWEQEYQRGLEAGKIAAWTGFIGHAIGSSAYIAGWETGRWPKGLVTP